MNYIKLGQAISRAKVSRCGDNDYPVLSITMKDGIVMQSDKFKKRIASKDISEYKVIPAGMLVQGIHMDEGNFGIQDIVPYGIVSPAYTVWTVDESVVFPKYIEMVLRSPRCIDYYRSKLNGTVNRRGHMSEGDFLGMQIPCPSIEEQKYVVTTMNQVKQVMISLTEEMTALDQLIKARFVELFGDMLTNPMNWLEQKLEYMADIVSGITKGRNIQTSKLFSVPYMAVSNVKDGYIDWTTVKTIDASQAEINQYRLMPNDVLMTEGGDPDKLGRGAIIHDPPKDCIHQNHIFRVRLDQRLIIPVFMEQYLQHQRAKRYFLGCAKQTTGIASINMKQLRALPMLMPPLELQEQFATFVSQVDKSKVVDLSVFTNRAKSYII